MPSIFGGKPGAKEICRHKRYEAVKCRLEKREVEFNCSGTNEQGDNSMHNELEKYKDLESRYNALEEEYRRRMCELTELKECLTGRGFPYYSLLEKNDNLTSFYTGLHSYSVLTCLFCHLLTKPLCKLLMPSYQIINVFSLHL